MCFLEEEIWFDGRLGFIFRVTLLHWLKFFANIFLFCLGDALYLKVFTIGSPGAYTVV